MHPGAPAEPVLVAWGITSNGKPVFLGMEPGSSESHDAWAGFFQASLAEDFATHCWSSATAEPA